MRGLAFRAKLVFNLVYISRACAQLIPLTKSALVFAYDERFRLAPRTFVNKLRA